MSNPNAKKPQSPTSTTQTAKNAVAREHRRGAYIQRKMRDQNSSKRAIADKIAEDYVRDLKAVLLDAGSTGELVAEALFRRHRYLTVLTNNMGAYAAYTRVTVSKRIGSSDKDEGGILSENELLMCGGRYDATYEALFGKQTLEAIEQFTPNLTIIGVSGLRWGGGLGDGVFCHGYEEVAVKKLLLSTPTDTRLIATDWSKIGKRDALAFGQLDRLAVGAKRAVVITCYPPKTLDAHERQEFDEHINKMKENGIEVELVGQSE